MSKFKVYGELSKVEEQDDGTLRVYGYASSEAVDSDGETITADAMKAALPDYMKFGAVREMHQPKAAGTAIEANVQDDGRTYFGAHVVDSEAVKKVKTGVYKGFSIGGKVTARDDLNKSIIKGVQLIEVSLVDRPANPEAVFTMYKADDLEKPATPEQVSAVDELAELVKSGKVSVEQLVALAKGASHETAGAAGVAADSVAAQPEQVSAAPAADEVKKGMWEVAGFAQLLASISYMVNDSQWESEYEGDNSPIPQQLRDWLTQGVAIFSAMSAEETNELLANLKQPEPMETVEMSAMNADTFKAAMDEMRASLLQEVKALVQPEPVTKAAQPEDDLKKVSETLAKALTRIAELEKQPATPKGVLKSVTKGEDLSGETAPALSVEPVTKADGSIDMAATMIKMIHQQGGNR